ncbi:diacylglycerol/lipid kinase family protein [Sphingomonas bacterium]|uniref:diacylglycerol/lipid kinase family protein n=1 Tax=Sphingomonas bacterium TaxID=1895847 RepID=UPI001575CD53|nr:diacylglycerol kinase family protein [Sphingomonas bacterium]
MRYDGVMNSPIPVFVNRSGGAASKLGDALEAKLSEAFAAAGLVARVRAIEGRDIAEAVGKAAGHGLVAVGGGDGTIGCAAGALVDAGSEAALAILPLGTRNHLAGELGIPSDLAQVARLIAAGHTRRIDLGRVNGRAFVNNASIGFYPDMVESRDAARARRGLPKWLANLPAAWVVLGRARHHRLRLRLEGDDKMVRTPMLFVGNNRYELTLGRVGRRAALDDGKLSVYAVERGTPLRLAALAARAMIGRADPERDFAALADVAAFEVEAHARSIRVAIDGEVVRLKSPLRFEVQAKALKVIGPPQDDVKTTG